METSLLCECTLARTAWFGDTEITLRLFDPSGRVKITG